MAAGYVPEAGSFVFAGSGESATIRTERRSTNEIAVTVEAGQRLTGSDIPESDSVILAGNGESLAIRAERRRGNIPASAAEGV